MQRFLIILFGIIFYLNSLVGGMAATPSEFLHTSKENLKKMMLSKDPQPLHFVMGNESADLDSIVSSIAYAYELSVENPSGSTGGLYLPLLNIRKDEISLRKDILYLFQLLDISIEDLIFVDDKISLNFLFEEGRLYLNLVDHNVLRPAQAYLSNTIERIVDHHVDEHKHYPLLSNENKLIANVGSNTTLIAEKILSNQQMMIPELALLLLSPILVDTSNLQSLEKTTDRDIKAVDRLRLFGSTLIPNDLYERLRAAKHDVADLTPDMLLSKDFKEYLDNKLMYGISVISSLPPASCGWIEDEQKLHAILEKFAQNRNLALLILLVSSEHPEGPKDHHRLQSFAKIFKGL